MEIRRQSCSIAGSILITEARTSVTVRPSNVARPVSISNRTQPNAQMSALLSTLSPRACSGDIYAAVPRITPCCVAASLSVGEFDRFTFSPISGKCLRQSKVQYLHFAVRRDFDIGRFEIAVDDALLMSCFEGFGDLQRQLQGFLDGDWAASSI